MPWMFQIKIRVEYLMQTLQEFLEKKDLTFQTVRLIVTDVKIVAVQGGKTNGYIG